MTLTTVLEVAGQISLGNSCTKTKLSDSIKRYTYPSPSKANPQTNIKSSKKINFNGTKNEKSKNTCDK